ncbi:MAG TPA: sugar phosphate isomerase/epimerase [Tepidisphaeraceae bacterium]|jgi:sugar phosphate isomerase/epimerase|nr:sugar phosphate isomerase/epimerase [Tepidisphaeraceae bacterium]
MQLQMCRTWWGAPTDLETLVTQTVAGGFDGIEMPIPKDAPTRKRLRELLSRNGLSMISEVTTGLSDKPTYDWWVPEPHFTVDDHLRDLQTAVNLASEVEPLFISTMCGYDAWSLQQNLDFFGRGVEMSERSGVTISFETHRCRSLFNPWITRDVIAALPTMKLTCDFSHWCVVAERLIDTEMDIIRQCAARAHHVHCRVGYAQHAQVPDPAAPEYQPALLAHERWWDEIWQSQRARGMPVVTMTSEFGPDGYMQQLPYTQQPVANLWNVVCWQGQRQKQRFGRFKS